MSWSIRQLKEEDADAFRTIRLEALLDSPEAFGGNYDEESREPLETFATQLTGSSAVFGAFQDRRIIAVMGLFWSATAKRRHIGNLYSVYVTPGARGSGCALPLIDAVLDHARQLGQNQVMLGVGVANEPALKLYRRAGFEIYGTEPRALYVNGRYVDEHMMVRFLDKAPGKQT